MQRRSLIKKKLEPGVLAEGTDGVFGDAISLAASRVNELAPLQGLLPDGEDDAFISFGRVASSSSSSSASSSEACSGDGNGYESDRSDMPDRSVPSAAPSSPTTREAFSGVIFEQRVAVDVREAHLTLVTLPSPVTIQGPCGVYGLGGETSINGYLIGQKRLALPTRYDRATAAPVKRLGTKTSDVTAPPHSDTDPESVFGAVNWAWVQERLESWSRRNPVQISLLLVIQHRDSCKKQWFETSTDTTRELPSFIASHRYLSTPQPVLDIISIVAKQRQAVAAVLGERDVGKSTMCRMLANALLSQHGRCYWIDLDLGQPEFTVPGCLSVAKVLRPLTTDLIPKDCWSLEKSFFLGTTSIACPVAYATAVKTLCDYVSASGCFPCVINTHGWVQSSGRRGSLECLRRLRASHIYHLGKSRGGDDMAWSVGSVINDPTQGFNESISNGRFWHGTDVQGALPAVESTYNPQYGCRVQHVEIAAGPSRGVAAKAGKREREEQPTGNNNNSIYTSGADATVYRIIADYVLRPKGDNVKRRRAKWFNYFNPLWSGDSADRCELTFDLAKLPFIALAGSDETSASVNSVAVARGALTETLRESVVALCVERKPHAGSAKSGAVLLSSFAESPSVLSFGVVVAQEGGTVTVLVPHPPSHVAEVFGPHRGRVGVVVSSDRGDYGGVISKVSAALSEAN